MPAWRVRVGSAGVAVLTVMVSIGATFAISLPPVAAQSSNDKKQQLQQQLGDASAEEAAALLELQGIRDKKAGIDARVADLDGQVAAAQATLAPLQADAQRIAAQLAGLQGELDQAQAELDQAQAELDTTAAQLYRSARRGSAYDAALATPPDELTQTNHYLDHVSAKRRSIVERVTGLRDEIDDKRRSVAASKAQADNLAAKAQRERDAIAALRDQIEPARAEAAQRQTEEEQALAGIAARKDAFEAELQALQAASDSLAARLRAQGSGPGAAGACEARPVPGEVRSGFGSRVHPVYGTVRMHNGADMAAGAGTPIHACREGTVVIAGPNGGYGNTVVIDHGGGMATLYAHQTSVAVNVGDRVSSDQVVGYVGSTGVSTGPHLHFEVRLNGNPVDPVPYL